MTPAPYHRPGYRITLAGEDITPRINGRLVTLRVTSQRGGEADQLDLTLADHDGQLAIPPGGASLNVAIGWTDEGLIDRGVFVVDEVEHSGAPDRLTLRARAADMRKLLPGKRSQSWHDVTLAEIVRTIAGRHALEPIIGETLGGIRVGHIDQTDESDLNFLTRLGERFDAIAAVKSERMLFTLAGEALTASGLALPSVTLTRRDGDRHRYSRTDRDSYTGVRAYWNDTDGAERQPVIAGTDDKLKDLRATYATEADALEAARSGWRRIRRGEATFELNLAHGRADLAPETPITLSGWKPEIDGAGWIVTEVEDTLDDSGYVTRVRCELKNQ
ncbi:contractile injection system protein, VgrG/Pvc8 family [Salinicola aestuarinus]|uniref:contractile injection system protein, VgrG/Pvc8 family n=1 Tax=Salinicola aestuarinus TaxID=1949082 RepID=UPI000DA1934B|nr:contractile injection system protein, VgrG/Pvc8 family [Salinicola aestuarinus]